MGLKTWLDKQAAKDAEVRQAKKLAKAGAEYRRTCQRCGHVWYIPASLVAEKAPGKLDILSAKLDSAGANMSLISFSRRRKQEHLYRLEDKQQRVIANSQCPQCGSAKFEQVVAD